MRWRKLGIVFRPDASLAWSRTHAMVPTPLLMPDLGVLRVFYTGCDDAGIGRPGYVDLDPLDPTKVVSACRQPLLDVGRPGTFDENGVLTTSVVRLPDGRLFMYFVGFELGTRIRYRLLTGLAISEDGGRSFHRHSNTPMLERTPEDLYFRGGTFVRLENGVFRMWYVGGSSWLDIGGKPLPEYRIKYLESRDGMAWDGHAQVVVDITEPDEHGFGRPWVVPRHDAGYTMYYSVRRKSFGAYRMGCATSPDGLSWRRQDADMGLDVGPDAFDNHAIMYAAVIEVDGRTYCYYNGNEFGKDGFAVAVLEEE